MDTRSVERMLDKTAKTLTPALRAHAMASGWPLKLARSLTVVHDGNGLLHVSYPTDVAKQVEDTEFGTPNRSARPAFNSFFQTEAGVRRIKTTTTSSMDEITKQVRKLFA